MFSSFQYGKNYFIMKDIFRSLMSKQTEVSYYKFIQQMYEIMSRGFKLIILVMTVNIWDQITCHKSVKDSYFTGYELVALQLPLITSS